MVLTSRNGRGNTSRVQEHNRRYSGYVFLKTEPNNPDISQTLVEEKGGGGQNKVGLIPTKVCWRVEGREEARAKGRRVRNAKFRKISLSFTNLINFCDTLASLQGPLLNFLNAVEARTQGKNFPHFREFYIEQIEGPIDTIRSKRVNFVFYGGESGKTFNCNAILASVAALQHFGIPEEKFGYLPFPRRDRSEGGTKVARTNEANEGTDPDKWGVNVVATYRYNREAWTKRE
jgi:hypothetical protein